MRARNKTISFSDVVKYLRKNDDAVRPGFIESILGTSNQEKILGLLKDAASEYVMPADDGAAPSSKITITTSDDKNMATDYHTSNLLPPLEDFVDINAEVNTDFTSRF
jgi:hypothetical protein